jgi:hypothetical protein
LLLFFSLTSCDDLLTTTIQKRDDRELEPRARLPCRFDGQIGRQRQIAACVRLHLGGRRADAAGRGRGGLARVEIRFTRHLVASQVQKSAAISLVGGDLFAVDGDLIHKVACSTSMPSPLHAVIAASAAPRVRTWVLALALRTLPAISAVACARRPHARPSARRA